jgi:hypothetical protein
LRKRPKMDLVESGMGKMRFKVFTALAMKISVFWNGAPCSLVQCKLLPDYTASHPSRQ